MICIDCSREMKCSRTGQKFRWGAGYCYSGDVHECNNCGAESCYISSKPFHDTKSPAIQMDTEVANG